MEILKISLQPSLSKGHSATKQASWHLLFPLYMSSHLLYFTLPSILELNKLLCWNQKEPHNSTKSFILIAEKPGPRAVS